MITRDQPIKLSNIGDGELERQFEKQLQKVYKNIIDTETTEETREINIKIGIKPSGDNRNVLQIGFAIKRKDAPVRPYVTGAIFDKESGKLVAKEFKTPEQSTIPFKKVKGNDND